MTPARATALLAAVAIATIAATPGAAAHAKVPDPIVGRSTIPAGTSVPILVDDLHGRDTLWVEFIVAEGPGLTATVTWTDSAGGKHSERAQSTPTTHGEFRFVAPDTLAGATIVIANPGTTDATVDHQHLASAPFWRSPNLWFPAVLPFLFLAACALLAWLARPWIRLRGTGPVRPPGWEEAHATKRAPAKNDNESEARTL